MCSLCRKSSQPSTWLWTSFSLNVFRTPSWSFRSKSAPTTPWKPETWGTWTQKVCVDALIQPTWSDITLFLRAPMPWHFIPYLEWEISVNIVPCFDKTWGISSGLKRLCAFMCCLHRHRSADHHQRHGDPHLAAHPRDAGGVLPVPGVRLQHPRGGGSRAYRRAGCVPPLQHHPQPGARSQSLPIFRQTDGESSAGLIKGQIAFTQRHLISECAEC